MFRTREPSIHFEHVYLSSNDDLAKVEQIVADATQKLLEANFEPLAKTAILEDDVGEYICIICKKKTLDTVFKK